MTGDGDGEGEGDGDGEGEVNTDYASGERLRAEVLVSAGGTRSFKRWWDSERSEYCRFLATESGVRCVPEAASSDLGLFADDQCTVVLVGGDPDPCGDGPQYAKVFGAYDACADNRPLGMYELGASYTGAVYSGIGPGECFAETASGDIWELGAAIDDADFVGSVLETEMQRDSSASLAPRRRVADDGAWIREYVADAQTDRRERTVWLDDSIEHYVPDSGAIEWASDDGCTQLIVGEGVCDDSPQHALLLGGDACAPSFEAYAIGDAYTGALWGANGGSCEPDEISDWPD